MPDALFYVDFVWHIWICYIADRDGKHYVRMIFESGLLLAKDKSSCEKTVANQKKHSIIERMYALDSYNSMVPARG